MHYRSAWSGNQYSFFSFYSITGEGQDWLWGYFALFIYGASIWKMARHADKSILILCICTKNDLSAYLLNLLYNWKHKNVFSNLSQHVTTPVLLPADQTIPEITFLWSSLRGALNPSCACEMPFKPTESRASDSLESTAERRMPEHHCVHDMLPAKTVKPYKLSKY